MNWASIIALDYTLDPMEPRVEHSITFFSDDWESLVDLLEDPKGFMLKQSANWPQDPEGSKLGGGEVPWKLLTPITTEVAPGSQSVTAVLKVAHIHGIDVDAAKDECKSLTSKLAFDFEKLEERAREAILSVFCEKGGKHALHENLAKQVRDILPNGGYVAEFAPMTHLLQVYYWAPEVCTKQCAEDALHPWQKPAGHRHSGPFTKTTVGLDGTAGTMHFDIGKGARARAQFVVDHIENCARTCQRLNTEYSTIYKGQTKLVPEGQTIYVESLEQRVHDTQPFLVPMTLTVIPGDGDEPETVVVTVTEPSVVIDAASDSTDPYVCSMQPVSTSSTSMTASNPITLKDYTDPTPTPPPPPPPTPPVNC